MGNRKGWVGLLAAALILAWAAVFNLAGAQDPVPAAETPPPETPVVETPGAEKPAKLKMDTSKPEAETGGIVANGDTLVLNMPEMELEALLKNFSQITGLSFVLDQVPKGQAIFIGPIGPIKIHKTDALKLFMLIMDINGFVTVKTSVAGLYKIAPKAEAIKDNLEIYPPGEAPETSERLVTRIIQCNHISAQTAAGQLQNLAGKDGGQVQVYPPLNMLFIVDTAINIERMLKVLAILDVPSPEQQIEIIKLLYSTPAEIVGIISQIFQGQNAAAGGAPAARTASTAPNPRARRRQTPAELAQQQPPPQPGVPPVQQVAAASAEGPGGPQFIPLERINSILVIADKDMMIQVREMICKLDIDTGTTGTIHVYYVQYAEAVELAGTLTSLSGGGGRSTGTTARSTRSTTSRTTTRTQTGQTPQVPGMAQQAATPTTPSVPGGGGGTMSAGSLQGILAEEVSISTDEATNALIVVATPQDWKILLDVIEKLDIPRRQVFVEAILIEITYNAAKDMGVSMHGASPLADNGLVLAGTGFTTPSSIGVLSSLAATGGLALPSGITMGALARPIDIDLGATTVQVPGAGIVVRMLQKYADVNVLSTPTILTTDNQEASIEVGQKIPVPTGQTVSGTSYLTSNISRETIGIKLKLTPKINESDNIKLDIFTEISGVVSNSLGIDPNTTGVITSLKTVETSVIVNDSQTIVIGGLMQDSESETINLVPFLGEIPLLGSLFRSQSNSNDKTNLIILITPHIVRTREDIDMIHRKLSDQYRQLEQETRGERNPKIDPYLKSPDDESQPSVKAETSAPSELSPDAVPAARVIADPVLQSEPELESTPDGAANETAPESRSASTSTPAAGEQAPWSPIPEEVPPAPEEASP